MAIALLLGGIYDARRVALRQEGLSEGESGRRGDEGGGVTNEQQVFNVLTLSGLFFPSRRSKTQCIETSIEGTLTSVI